MALSVMQKLLSVLLLVILMPKYQNGVVTRNTIGIESKTLINSCLLPISLKAT